MYRFDWNLESPAIQDLKHFPGYLRFSTLSPRTTVMVTHDIDEALLTSQKILVLSARPARIVDVVDVPHSYPRSRGDDSLFKLKTRILQGLGVIAGDYQHGEGI